MLAGTVELVEVDVTDTVGVVVARVVLVEEVVVGDTVEDVVLVEEVVEDVVVDDVATTVPAPAMLI